MSGCDEALPQTEPMPHTHVEPKVVDEDLLERISRAAYEAGLREGVGRFGRGVAWDRTTHARRLKWRAVGLAVLKEAFR